MSEFFRKAAEQDEAEIADLRSHAEALAEALGGLFSYTGDLERRYATWAASRPSLATWPDNAEEVGKAVRAALAAWQEFKKGNGD